MEAWTAWCMDGQHGAVNTTEEIRRIEREELHRRNRPASINCFERTQTYFFENPPGIFHFFILFLFLFFVLFFGNSFPASHYG